MAEWLALRGHEVRVVTAPPYYPEWKVGQGYSGWRYRKETFIVSNSADQSFISTSNSLQDNSTSDAVKTNQLTVFRCPLWVPKKQSGLKRIVHLTSFVVCSLPVMAYQIGWRPDVVLGVAPPFVGAPLAWVMAKIYGARAWLHIQDFELDAALQLNLVPAYVRRPLERIERFVLRRFDRVSTISQKMQEKLTMKGVA